MTETALITQPDVALLPMPEQAEVVYKQREAALKDLLDPAAEGEDVRHFPNYEYAKDSGLFDHFYFNPVTGRDGIRHTLEGDMRVAENGSVQVAGFHHEPSSRRADTFVDYEEVAKKKARTLRNYRRYPFEPYRTNVVIHGYAKSILEKSEDGTSHVVSAKSSMFPAEYDALAVLQAARIAKETRNTSQDAPGDKSTIVTEGFAPMLDGKSQMQIRLILDADTEQILTAFPMTRREAEMELSPESINQHLGL